jgi:hypothetical protein
VNAQINGMEFCIFRQLPISLCICAPEKAGIKFLHMIAYWQHMLNKLAILTESISSYLSRKNDLVYISTKNISFPKGLA